MKTLGQIAFEAFYKSSRIWAYADRDAWESVAKAVQAEDRKRLIEKITTLQFKADGAVGHGFNNALDAAVRIIKEEL